MRPVVVTVGPLAAASANAVSLSQTPIAGTLLLNGTPTSGTNTNAFVGTASITGNVMTVTATSTGAMSAFQKLRGQGVLANTNVIGPGLVANTWTVYPPQTVSSTTIYGNALVTLDCPRQVLFTFSGNETGHNFVISGTDGSGDLASETIVGTTAGTVASVLSYATVNQIVISANATAALTVGTNTVADSGWVRLDEWANPSISLACVVSGTVNYTVQQSLDDPNSPTNPVTAAAMTWQNFPDLVVVAATATAQSTYTLLPVWMRVLLNSGSGTVTTTVTQTGVVPY